MEQERLFNRYGADITVAYRSLLRKVYLWMALALVVTGMTAAYVAADINLIQTIVTSRGLFFGLIIAELALVWILSARVMQLSFATAGLMFVGYSVLNGVTMSLIFLLYTAESIATTFYITAGTFAAMSLIGYTTKRDLSSLRSYFLMALVGLIIASLVNMFLQNGVLYWVISYVGVLLFVGLTVYDTQKIKQMLQTYGYEVNDETQKLALMGSLTLYLDFINLFLYLLRILGDRRE